MDTDSLYLVLSGCSLEEIVKSERTDRGQTDKTSMEQRKKTELQKKSLLREHLAYLSLHWLEQLN